MDHEQFFHYWEANKYRLIHEKQLNIRELEFQTFEIKNRSNTVINRSMLSLQEIALLYNLARDYYLGAGEIVDLGSLLGVSTNALAKGLTDNRQVKDKQKRIYAFDLFLAHDMGTVGNAKPSYTGSVFDLFLETNVDYVPQISIAPGNLLHMKWEGPQIEILFVDVAKSWPLNNYIMANYFEKLIPGRSLVIQQDYVHYHEYWIHITMEYFAEYFELMGYVYASSAVYLYKKEIPKRLLYRDLSQLTLDEQQYYLSRAKNKGPLFIQDILTCCQAQCYYAHREFQKAIETLQHLDVSFPYPEPERCYAEIIQSNINMLEDALRKAYGRSAFAQGNKDEYRASLEITLDEGKLTTDTLLRGFAKIKNIGSQAWDLVEKNVGTVHLGTHLLRADGIDCLTYDFSRHALGNAKNPSKIDPHEEVQFEFFLKTPKYGSYVLEFDLVSEMICWFKDRGSATIRIPITVE